MLTTTLAILVASVTPPAAGGAPIAATAALPFSAAVTATYRPASRQFCIRDGAMTATLATQRPVTAGECRSAQEWRLRGIHFDTPGAARR